MPRRLVVFLLLLAFAFSPVFSEKRVALVIGNGAYESNARLKNPASDAADIATALKASGFTVTSLVDADRVAMEKAVRDFGNALKESEAVGLFYYSGHGVQVEGSNYLLPVDADIQEPDELAYKAMNAELVLAKMRSAGNRLNIVILDACRNNPFPGATRSAERGLAVVGVKVPESIIVYATDPGSVAQDGDGRNSPFTKAFIEQVAVPGQDIAVTLKRVTSAVKLATGGVQTPWVSTNYTVDFAFRPGDESTNPPPAPAVAASLAPGAAVKMTVTAPKMSYGSLAVTSTGSGALFLDGRKLGDLQAGTMATLDNIEIGSRLLEFRYVEGLSESRSVTVADGKPTSVSFDLQAAASVQASVAATLDQSRFARLPGGVFTMGSPASEKGRASSEGPQHKVGLSPFTIGKYEVTFDEYDAYCVSTGAAKPNDGGWGRGARPVINVSWFDAVSYCNWLSKQAGLESAYTISGVNVIWNRSANGYRLPTEAEWEYACRAGKGTATAYGNTLLSSQANFDGNFSYNVSTKGEYLQKTAVVGSYPANAWGLFDMHGNVWEWCWDWYDTGYYSKSASTDPAGQEKGDFRVHRGGSWGNLGDYLRSASRASSPPAVRSNRTGFRVVR